MTDPARSALNRAKRIAWFESGGGDADAGEDADRAADRGEQNRFGQELGGYVAPEWHPRLVWARTWIRLW